MPLMQDWAHSLVTTLDGLEPGLASTIGLHEGLDGQQFEEALGSFLRWVSTFNTTERFLHVGRINETGYSTDVMTWLNNARQRSELIIRGVNTSLFDEFGLGRIDEPAAVTAYRNLFTALHAAPDGGSTQLFSVTTNYDRSGEVAIGGIGYRPDTGSRGPIGRTQRLEVGQLEAWGPSDTVPHLHLHGAVGWYRENDGAIRIDPADQPFDDRRQPAVLYPDPEKDPLGEAELQLQALWRVFRSALDGATHVLVLGHSLHDRPLLDAVGAAMIQPGKRLALCFYDAPEPIQGLVNQHEAFSQSTDLSLVPIDFAPGRNFELLERWIEGAIIEADGSARGGPARLPSPSEGDE